MQSENNEVTPVENDFIDNVIPLLTSDEVKVYLVVKRLCFGTGNYTAYIRPAVIMDMTSLSGVRALNALMELISHDIIVELDDMAADGQLYGIGTVPSIEGLKERIGLE